MPYTRFYIWKGYFRYNLHGSLEGADLIALLNKKDISVAISSRLHF